MVINQRILLECFFPPKPRGNSGFPNLESLHLLCWPWLALLKPTKSTNQAIETVSRPARLEFKNPRAPWGLVLARQSPKARRHGGRAFQVLQIANCHPVDRHIFSPAGRSDHNVHLDASEVVCRPYFLTFWGLKARHGQKTKKDKDMWWRPNLPTLRKNPTFLVGFGEGGMGSPDDLHRKLMNLAVVCQS